MTWENFQVGDTGRKIRIPQLLKEAVTQYTEDKKVSVQNLFDQALVTLWRMYNGNTETNEPVSPLAEQKIRAILSDNPPPKGKSTERIYITFRGELTYKWVCKLEKLYMIHGIEDCIRRTISFYLRKKGYIKDEIGKKIYNQYAEVESTLVHMVSL